ncbi:phiSA1p31-related protein [Streptomyces sp. NPDC005907]|uniref:phiSA1p31-related protein n=1 Tax=Streptomyces sp. NPDC005907 TaxID=3154571 RepID=UPI0033D6D70F
MTTFEVGQKVRVFGTQDGEIVYGPATSTFGAYVGYVVNVDGTDKWYKAADLEAAPTLPTFAVGDEVTLTTRPGARATVEYGPFDGRDVYVVKLVDKPADPEVQTFTALANIMKPADDGIKVGDRVRVLKDDPVLSTGRFVGKIGTVLAVGGSAREELKYRLDFGSTVWWVAEVERVDDADTCTHDGVTYDLTATYRDKDGDDWKLRRNPTNRDDVQAQMPPIDDDEWTHYTLPSVLRLYGPLTRV